LRKVRFAVGSVRSWGGPPGRKAARTRAFVAPNVTTLSESMVAQDELYDPVVAGQRELLGLLRRHGKRNGVHGDRLVLLLLDDLPAASTCMFSRTTLGNFIFPLVGTVVRITSTLVYGTMNPPLRRPRSPEW
jgi:hypothetical protein